MYQENDIRKHQKPIQLSRELIHNKYYDTFNFYFSKPINEILFDVRLPHVIMFKDLAYYDDETEYLKRFYKRGEVKPKMENMTSFYFALTEGAIKLTLPLHDQNEIILRRNEKLNKLLLSKLQSLAEPAATQRESHPNPEPNNILEEKIDSKQEPEEKKEVEEVKEDLGKSENVLDAQDNSVKHMVAAVKEVPANESFQKILPETYEFVHEVSYDSIRHDIYNPEFSVEIKAIQALQQPALIEEEQRENKKTDMKSNLFFHATNWNILAPSLNPPQLLFQTDKPSQAPAITVSKPVQAGGTLDDIPSEPLSDIQGRIVESKGIEDFKESDKASANKLSNSISFAKKDDHINASQQNESQSFVEKSPSLIKELEVVNSQNDGIKLIEPSFTPPKEAEHPHPSEISSQSHRNSREDRLAPARQETSTTHIHFGEENVAREMKYPIITIKNIQINKINPLASLNGQPSVTPPLQNQSLPAPRPQLPPPQYEPHRNPDSRLKHSDQNHSNESNEVGPKELETSADHADPINNLAKSTSRPTFNAAYSSSGFMTDRFKESSILAKLTKAKQDGEANTNRRYVYNNANLRSTLKNGLSTANTTAVQSINTMQSNPNSQYFISTNNGSMTSRAKEPTNSDSKKSHTRLKSNEGLVFAQDSVPHTAPASRNSHSSKNIHESYTVETIPEVTGSSQDKKADEPQRFDLKRHNKSKSITAFLPGQNSLKLNIDTAHNIINHPINYSRPATTSNKQNFKLDLGAINNVNKSDANQIFSSSKSARNSQRNLIQQFNKLANDKSAANLHKDPISQIKPNQANEKKYSAHERLASNFKPDLINQAVKGDLLAHKTAVNMSARQAYISSLQNSKTTYNNIRKTPTSSRANSISLSNQQGLNRKVGNI